MIGNLKFALNNLYFSFPSLLRISEYHIKKMLYRKTYLVYMNIYNIYMNYSGIENIKTDLIQIHKSAEKTIMDPDIRRN